MFDLEKIVLVWFSFGWIASIFFLARNFIAALGGTVNKVKMLENKQIEVQMEAILDSKKGQRYSILYNVFIVIIFIFIRTEPASEQKTRT